MSGNKNEQLSHILRLIAENLEMPQELFQRAEEKYKEVGQFLGDSDSSLYSNSPEIYPQGSTRLGTIIRPITDIDEYDIDLVCLLQLKKQSISQNELKKRIGDQLREHQKYREVLSEGRRCWILNFEKRFHMDILPAIPDQDGQPDSILITDKDLTIWQFSNPKGYALWFYSQMRAIFETERLALAKAMGADIEEVPDWKVKTPLQRAVQLLKRHRDIYFQNDHKDKPASIIISTLAANAYAGQADLLDALFTIVQTMPDYIKERNGEYWVENPINENENFADKWIQYPQRKNKFYVWLKQLNVDLNNALVSRNLPELSTTLEKSFGSKAISTAFKNYGGMIHQQRKTGNLLMAASTGILGSTGTTQVKGHTFYGEMAEAETD